MCSGQPGGVRTELLTFITRTLSQLLCWSHWVALTYISSPFCRHAFLP